MRMRRRNLVRSAGGRALVAAAAPMAVPGGAIRWPDGLDGRLGAVALGILFVRRVPRRPA